MGRIALVALIAVSSLAGCASALPMSASNNELHAVERSTYQVSWDLEYGYVFDRAGDRFFPEIAESETSEVRHLFSNANLEANLGKRIYCDCEISRALGGSRRRVERATLYAR
jgi:hypothetical protein